MRMTDDQFEALATLMGLHLSPSRDAARLILVDGMTPVEAGKQTGITRQGAWQSAKKCKRMLTIAMIATGQLTSD